MYDTGDDNIDTVLKGVVRAERLDEPSEFIPAILRRVKREYIQILQKTLKRPMKQ